MRPVDKSPDLGKIKPYQEAQKPLKDRLGSFCSYCERWICNAQHVEHKMPKDQDRTLEFEWENFLLACSNCNSSRPKTITALVDYLWPDKDNTFRAFFYDREGRIFCVPGFSPVLDPKVKATWEMFGLDRHPDVHSGMRAPTPKDDRWLHRKEAWKYAERMKRDLAILDSPERRETVVESAQQRGMFSIWMKVFESDEDMCARLIQAFPGTDAHSFDAMGRAVQRPSGQI